MAAATLARPCCALLRLPSRPRVLLLSAVRVEHCTRAYEYASRPAFSTTSPAPRANKDDDGSAASSIPPSAQAGFEQRRILDDLRRATGKADSSGSSTSKALGRKRVTVDDFVLGTETLRRAQTRPGGLSAAAELGAGGDDRPSLLDKITAEGKPWKELKTGQKVARTTRYSTRILIVTAGGILAFAIVYTLGTELFAPNSPTVIYADAIKRIKRHEATYTYLLEPLRFMTHPPRNDMTDPRETLLPLPASARSALRAHKPVAAYTVDPRSGREVMQLRFWIMGRERGTELGWFDEARGWVEHQARQLSARVQEAWEQADWNGTGSEARGSGTVTVAEAGAEADVNGTPAGSKQGSSVGAYLTAPFRTVGSLFGSLSKPVADVGLSAGDIRWGLGRNTEPGTFTTAEAVAELEKDDAGVFQYRSLYLRVPHDGIMAQRLWIVMKKGEVTR